MTRPRSTEDDGDQGVVSERSTAFGSALNGIGSLIGTALSFLLVIIITRNYGADDAGVFFGVVALFAILGTATKLGTETALVFQVARFRATGSNAAIRAAVSGALGPVFIASAVCAALLIVFADPIASLFNGDRSDDFASVLRWLAPFLPAWSLGLVLLGATRGVGTMRPTALGLQMVQPALQITLVYLAARGEWALERLALGWGAPLVVTLLIAASSVLPHLRGSGDGVDPAAIRRELWGFATPRGIAGTLQVSLDRVGILLIGALTTSTAAGQWAAISRLIGVAQRSFHAIGQALNPRLSVLADRHDWAALARVHVRITVATIAVLAPAIAGLALFPKSALDLFGGPEFEEVSTALVIAAVATLGATALAHVDNILLMAGRSRAALFDTLAALVTTIVLNLVLIPPFGLNGAALAMAAGVLVYRGAAASQIRRWYDVNPLPRSVIAALAQAVVVLSAVLIAGRLIGGDLLGVAIASGVVAVVVHAAVFHGLRHRIGFDYRWD